MAQYFNCDTLIMEGRHYIPFDSSGIKKTTDYINIKYPNLTEFLSNRKTLIEIPILLNAKNRMILGDDKIDINILFDTINVNPENYFIHDSLQLSFYNYNDIDMPYGITYLDSVNSYIEKITINDKDIPESAFSDLLNPNRFETTLSIKPIKGYLTNDNEFIYIYIFGKCNDSMYVSPDCFELSYMAKLIFDSKGNYINRIVERGEILNYFGFYNCPDFIGF